MVEGVREYVSVLGRVVTIIPLFLVVSLLMGKRHIGELSVFDLVIAVTLGAVAGADLADPEVPHGPTVMTVVVLGAIHQLISRIVLNHRRIGRYLTFDPMVVIQNGTILHKNLARVRYSVDELLSHLRDKDVFDLNAVEFAVLEPFGAVSVLRRAGAGDQRKGSAAAAEQTWPIKSATLPVPVVLAGRVHEPGLESAGRDRRWLEETLGARGFAGADQVFLALYDASSGQLYTSPMALPHPEQRLSH